VHHPQEGRAGDIAGQAADDARLQIDDKRVAEALVHEGHALIVGRDVGSLSEMSQNLDVGWKRIQRVSRFALGERAPSGGQQQEHRNASHMILPQKPRYWTSSSS
jgi:hypothetical protein